MVRIVEFKKEAAERLRALFPQVAEWQETLDATVGDQTVDLLVRFQMGQGQETKTLICETRSRGEPRYLREAITRLRELRPHLPGAYPIVAAPYVSPQSAALVRRNSCGYLDLSGNCYLAFDNVLIQKEGRPNAGLDSPPAQDALRPARDAGGAGAPGRAGPDLAPGRAGPGRGREPRPRPQRDQAARGARLGRAGPGRALPAAAPGRAARRLAGRVQLPRQRAQRLRLPCGRQAPGHGGPQPGTRPSWG